MRNEIVKPECWFDFLQKSSSVLDEYILQDWLLTISGYSYSPDCIDSHYRLGNILIVKKCGLHVILSVCSVDCI